MKILKYYDHSDSNSNLLILFDLSYYFLIESVL